MDIIEYHGKHMKSGGQTRAGQKPYKLQRHTRERGLRKNH